MIKRNWHYILLLFLLLDAGYSFLQHYHAQLDGDMAGIIMPPATAHKVLDDPLGLDVLLKNEVYPAPNRFFAHWTMSVYFKTVPLFCQIFLSPINSIYAACALAKTAIQIFIICILAFYCCGTIRITNKEFILSATLITPLFQAYGYNDSMGIIDKSITYTFFYALPLGLLLIFLHPYYNAVFNKIKAKQKTLQGIVLVILIFFLSLNGPLVPGIILIICIFILLNTLLAKSEFTRFNKLVPAGNKLQRHLFVYIMLFGIVSLYSLYIGLNNTDNYFSTLAPANRYLQLPEGIFFLLTEKLGFGLLLMMISLNGWIIKRKMNDTQKQKLMLLATGICVFSVVYILLLPLGGYRDYRPGIVRRDTIMPITICLIFLYAISSYMILKENALNNKKGYAIATVVFLLLFTIADEPVFNDNLCEKKALVEISQARDSVVCLNTDCRIMSWTKIRNFQESEGNSQLLEYWGVIKQKTFYYQK